MIPALLTTISEIRLSWVLVTGMHDNISEGVLLICNRMFVILWTQMLILGVWLGEARFISLRLPS